MNVYGAFHLWASGARGLERREPGVGPAFLGLTFNTWPRPGLKTLADLMYGPRSG